MGEEFFLLSIFLYKSLKGFMSSRTRDGGSRIEIHSSLHMSETSERVGGVCLNANMAAALENELDNDDYYSLLNVRREVSKVWS